MLSDWYKKQKARKEAPNLLRLALAAPVLGVVCIVAARWVLHDTPDFLSDDQVNFMVATLMMMGVPAFVFGGYCFARLIGLQRQSGLSPVELFIYNPTERD